MASPRRLLCVLSLLLCCAAAPALCEPRASASGKPIVGKEAAREPGLGPSRCRAPAAGAGLETPESGLRRAPAVVARVEAEAAFGSCGNVAKA